MATLSIPFGGIRRFSLSKTIKMKQLLHKALSFLVVLVLVFAAQAQTYTLGTGTLTNTTTGSNFTPYKTYWMDGRVQYLVLASELTALGMPPGTFTSVAFNVASADPASMGSFTIKMGGTTATSMTATYLPATTYTTVFGPSTYTASTGWNTHTFTTPFIWNGTDNVVIEVCFDNAAYTVNSTVFYGTTTFASSTDGFTDLSTSSGCTDGAITFPTAQSGRPNMQLGLVPATACSGTPTGGVATPSLTSVCPNQNFNLSLAGQTLASGLTYQWQSSSTATGPWTAIAGATSTFATVSQTSDKFYRCNVTCTASSTSAASTAVQVTTLPNLAAGTYTVGPLGTYPNLTAAFAAASCGVAGPVVFNVVPFTGPYTEQLILGDIPGLSATNTITVNGNGNTIQYQSYTTGERAVIKLNGTDYVTFKNLNVRAIGQATTMYGFGVQLMNGANFNTFKNCTIQATDSVTSTNYAGFVCSNTATSATGGGLAASNLTIDSCTIIGGYYGLTLGGTSGTLANLPTNNVVKNTMVRDFYLYGTYSSGQSGLIMKNNRITRATRTGAVSTFYGMYFFGRQVGSRIDGNRIYNPEGNFPATSTSIYPFYMSGVSGRTNQPMIICNNAVYNINNNAGLQSGLYSFGLDSARFFNNTIVLDNQLGTGTSLNYGMYLSGAHNDLQVRNNVFHLGNANTGTKYMLYYATSTSVPNSNNNAFDFTGAGGTSLNVGFLGSVKQTLALWQASTGTPDLASTTATPLFVDATVGNLMPQSGSVNNIGANTLAVVPTDILGVARTATPDLGAWEFTPTGCTPPTLTVVSVAGGTATIGVTSPNATTNYQFEYGPCGFTQGTGTLGTLNSNGNIVLTNLAPNTCYRVYVRSDCGTAIGQSMWVFAQFTTPCASGTMPYLEDFTTYPVQCWTQAGTQNWLHYTVGNPSIRANFWSWTSGNTGIYLTHPITISTAATVGFKWSHQYSTSYPLDGFVLRARKVGSTTWDTLFNKSGANLNTPGGGTTTPGTFQPELIYLPASYVGSDAIFELRGNSGFGPDLFIDDFEVKAVPACPDPVLTTTAQTSSSVSLTWATVTGTTPLKSKIIWGPAGFMTGTGAVGNVIGQINSPYTVTGLMSNTLYDFYVQDSCGTSFSNVVGPLTVKTACSSVLSGAYTVNPALPAAGTNFASLDSAVNYLNSCGISAATTFTLAAGNHTKEVVLGTIKGASALRPVIFTSASAAATSINAPLGSSTVVDLNGSKHVRFNNVTLNNTAGTYVVRLRGNADSIVVENSRLLGDTTSTSITATIASTGSLTSPTTGGADVDNIFIRNNVIKGGYYGITLSGTSLTSFDNKFVIENNKMTKQYYYGMRLFYIADAVVKGNSVKSMRNTFNYAGYYYYTRNLDVESNQFMATTYGLYVYYPNFNVTVAPAANNKIVNNMATGATYASYFYSPRYMNIYHNTFRGGAYGYYSTAATTAGQDLRELNIRNNIFAGSTNAFYQGAIYPAANNVTLNHNAYSSTGANVAFYGGNQVNLAAWQTSASTLNANSVAGNVLFVANDDLHILGAFPNNLGATGLGVATDIDGQVRPAAGATAPDMGADEFTPITDDAKVVALLGANGGCGSATTSLALVVENLGLNTITSLPVLIRAQNTAGGAPQVVNTTATVNIPSLGIDTITVGTVNTYNGGVFNFVAYASLANDGRANNDTVKKFGVNFIPFEPLVNAFPDTVCAGQDSIFLSAISYPGTAYAWYPSATGGTAVAMGNPAKVSTNQSTYYVQFDSMQSNAQVGNGTSVSASTLITPYKTFYMDGRVQYLVLASELAAAGANAGNINSVAFDVSVPAAQTLGNFTIKMGGTSLTAMAGSYVANTGFTTVFTNAAYAATAGWNVHTFTTPFLWNGSDNVIVEVCFDNGSYTSNTSVFYHTTTYASAYDGFADLATSDGCTPGNISGSAQSNRPNMKFNVTSSACSQIRKPVSFVNNPDVANAVYSSTQTAPGTFSFSAAGSNGDVYAWYFPGGIVATGTTATHTFPAPGGPKSVILVVLDSTCLTVDSANFTVNSTIGLDENTLGQNVYAFPNPSNGQVAIVLEGNEAFQGRMEIINAVGQVVVARAVETAAGRNEFPMDLRDLAKGVYTVRVASEAGQRQIRLVLQ